LPELDLKALKQYLNKIMENFKLFLLILWGVFLFFLVFLFINHIRYKKWLKQLEKKPLTDEEKNFLNKIEIYKKLPDNLKQILAFKIHRFKKEKQFVGIGLEINEEIKTVISFFACLPTLYYKYFCYPSLKYIYVYPHTVILNTSSQKNGIVSKEEILISGEAVGESVVIVWNESKKEAYHNLGRNVVIHEFAHELDFEEGAIDGIPPLPYSQYAQWGKIMFKEYNKLKNKILKRHFLGKYSFIDKYAATNKAEFFAVMSEYYFMKPYLLKKHFPNIYKELKNFYKVETNVC